MAEPPRILTVTPNPSLDALFAAPGLVWNDANRVDNPRLRPGGQGINVARAAAELGGEALAVAPLGGPVGRLLADMLEEEGVLRPVPIRGDTRVFVEARIETAPGEGRALLLNPRGPRLSEEEGSRLESAVADSIASFRPHFVAGCGSLPPGVPIDFYAHIGRRALEAGAAFVPDCDGDALARAASLATLLVPNRLEAARLLGREPSSAEEAADAALELARGERWVAIKLGEEGAVLAAGGRAWRCPAPAIEAAGSAVGAGDAFLAALLLARARGEDPPSCLAVAVAAGSAVLGSRGPEMIEAVGASALTRLVQVTAIRKSD